MVGQRRTGKAVRLSFLNTIMGIRIPKHYKKPVIIDDSDGPAKGDDADADGPAKGDDADADDVDGQSMEVATSGDEEIEAATPFTARKTDKINRSANRKKLTKGSRHVESPSSESAGPAKAVESPDFTESESESESESLTDSDNDSKPDRNVKSEAPQESESESDSESESESESEASTDSDKESKSDVKSEASKPPNQDSESDENAKRASRFPVVATIKYEPNAKSAKTDKDESKGESKIKGNMFADNGEGKGQSNSGNRGWWLQEHHPLGGGWCEHRAMATTSRPTQWLPLQPTPELDWSCSSISTTKPDNTVPPPDSLINPLFGECTISEPTSATGQPIRKLKVFERVDKDTPDSMVERSRTVNDGNTSTAWTDNEDRIIAWMKDRGCSPNETAETLQRDVEEVRDHACELATRSALPRQDLPPLGRTGASNTLHAGTLVPRIPAAVMPMPISPGVQAQAQVQKSDWTVTEKKGKGKGKAKEIAGADVGAGAGADAVRHQAVQVGGAAGQQVQQGAVPYHHRYNHAFSDQKTFEPDEDWSADDCQLLAVLEARQRAFKWKQLQADFFNITGRMMSHEMIKEKVTGSKD